METSLIKAPEQNLDWSNKQDVLEWYNSFELFNTYMSNKDSQNSIKCVANIVDGLVFYNGIYYVRSPISNGNNINFKKTDIENGLYNVILVTKQNTWHISEPKFGSDINVFTPLTKIKSISELKPFYENFIATNNYNSPIKINGTSRYDIELISLDVIKFFKDYYLINCGQYLAIIDDFELETLLNPIVPKFKQILKNAIRNSHFSLQSTTYWGEWELERITFNESVCNEIYELINKLIENN